MFSKLYKFSKFVMYLNSCSMDLGRDILCPPWLKCPRDNGHDPWKLSKVMRKYTKGRPKLQ